MGRRKARAEEESAGAPEWIVTFTDMISLLVTFFVLLMTFSTMEEHQLLRVKDILGGSGGALETERGSEVAETSPDDLIAATDPLTGATSPPERPTARITEPSQSGARRRDDTQHLDLVGAPDGLLVRFDAQASFAPGSAQPTAALVARLRQVAGVMRDYPHRVVVEGHTDDHFRATAGFPDAESLALARARGAADQLASLGIDRSRLQIAAHGATRPRDTRATPEARRANRRIEVRLVALDPTRQAEFERAWNDRDREGSR